MKNKFKFVTQEHGHNLRSANNSELVTPRPNKEIIRKSLDYSGAKLWNSIPLNIRNVKTIKEFQISCMKWHFSLVPH